MENMGRSNGRSPSPPTKRRHTSRDRFANFDETLTPERSRRPRTPSRSPGYRPRYASPRRDEYSKPPEPTAPYYRALCVSSLHPRASDQLVKDTLYREFRRFGPTDVKIQHESDGRVAYVCFRDCEDARAAKDAKSRIIVYDKVAVVERAYDSKPRYRNRSPSISPMPYYDRPPGPSGHFAYDHRTPYKSSADGYRSKREHHCGHNHRFSKSSVYNRSPYLPPQHSYDSYPYPSPRAVFKRSESRRFPNYLQHISPEDDPLATRTLFVGNLETNISNEELHHIFGRFGVIEDVDVKRPPVGTGNAFAFIRFQNLDMAHKAKVALSGNFIGPFQCKIGYGKAVPTPCIWVGGLGTWTSVTQLEREFDRFGAIKNLNYVKDDDHAYILYENIQAASAAVKSMRGYILGGLEHRLRVDFSNVELCESKTQMYASPVSYKSRSRSPIPSEEAGLTLSKIAGKCSKSWQGSFILKLSRLPANFYVIHGDDEVAKSLVNEENGERQIIITQRVRLESPQLQIVKDKIANAPSYDIILALMNPQTDVATNQDSMPPARHLNNLVSYFNQKQAAGVTILTNKESKGFWHLYSFSFCSFSAELLRRVYPRLSEKAMEESHLVVVAVPNDVSV